MVWACLGGQRLALDNRIAHGEGFLIVKFRALSQSRIFASWLRCSSSRLPGFPFLRVVYLNSRTCKQATFRRPPAPSCFARSSLSWGEAEMKSSRGSLLDRVGLPFIRGKIPKVRTVFIFPISKSELDHCSTCYNEKHPALNRVKAAPIVVS